MSVNVLSMLWISYTLFVILATVSVSAAVLSDGVVKDAGLGAALETAGIAVAINKEKEIALRGPNIINSKN